jgi:hypothetical protein
VKRECEHKLDLKKQDFQAMKRKIEDINLEENKLKEAFDQTHALRESLKQRADKIKIIIKQNRDKYRKSEDDYGADHELRPEESRESQMSNKRDLQPRSIEYFVTEKPITYTFNDTEITMLMNLQQ